jgi:ribosome-binding protein aMBF1 (putative translation factor)
MKCQRCSRDKEATHRAYSDVLNLRVCSDCASEARQLGISVEMPHQVRHRSGHRSPRRHHSRS